jgi:hypothetical protein
MIALIVIVIAVAVAVVLAGLAARSGSCRRRAPMSSSGWGPTAGRWTRA